jgi:hypothetical protein
MGHVEKNLSGGVAVEKEKEELSIKEVGLERIGVGMADVGTDGVEDART